MWTLPNGQYRNQIDYILCSRSWRSSSLSAKTRPGADCGSDHQLLIVKCRLKLKKVEKTTKPSSLVQFSHSVMSNYLWLLRLQHARLPFPSETLGVYPNSCPLSRWCHPTISSSVVHSVQFSSVQSLSRVWLFVTPWIPARQASLSITNSWSLPKLMSIESVMPPSHLILCRPLLLLPPIPPRISLFQLVNSSNEVAKVLEFQLQHQSFQWTPRTDLL